MGTKKLELRHNHDEFLVIYLHLVSLLDLPVIGQDTLSDFKSGLQVQRASHSVVNHQAPAFDNNFGCAFSTTGRPHQASFQSSGILPVLQKWGSVLDL
jgi:hypothetical protein